MRIEEVIGERIREIRELNEVTQEQLGVQLGGPLDKPWSRQAVSAAEKGQRAFTAAELVAIAEVLGTTVPRLMTPPITAREVELPGVALSRQQLTQRTYPRASASKVMDDMHEQLRGLVAALEPMQRNTDAAWKFAELLSQSLALAAEAERGDGAR